MSHFYETKAARTVAMGLVAERAAALPPQTDADDLFTVVGGRVLLRQIIGEVTIQIGNVANNTNLEFNPDDAARGDLCAVLDIDNDAVGTVYGITGTAANAMLDGTVIVAKQATELILKPGVIELHCAGNSGTGAIKWTVVYVPIDDGAHIQVS
jgi:hypothetical protein